MSFCWFCHEVAHILIICFTHVDFSIVCMNCVLNLICFIHFLNYIFYFVTGSCGEHIFFNISGAI